MIKISGAQLLITKEQKTGISFMKKGPSKNLIVFHMNQISSIKVFGLIEIYILLKNAGGYLEI